MTQSTITVFCAIEQLDTQQTLNIDENGEVLLTCQNDQRTSDQIAATNPAVDPIPCGHFLKFPKGTTVDELKALVTQHKTDNEGQFSVADMEAEAEALLAGMQS